MESKKYLTWITVAALAESPLNRMIAVARAKTRWMRWHAGIGVSISFIVPGGCIGFDPLKQFPRVIHGNHSVQGRIAMGSPAPASGVACGNFRDIVCNQSTCPLFLFLAGSRRSLIFIARLFI
jgi:hypothetical protein